MATRKAPTKKPAPRAAKAAADPEAAPASAAPDAPLNREQRRAQKFGRAGKVHQHDPATPWPENAANPALAAAGDQAAHTGRPDQDVTHQTGPGAGGATETADRTPEHEGMHGGNSTKG